MSTPVWPFTENPFDNGTKGSRKKMNIVSADHDSNLRAMSGNAAILPLYTYFNPVRGAFLQKYVQWMSAKAADRSATLAVEQLIAQLSGDKIEEFDIRIQNVYRRGTTQYQALLPDFRIPFQQGEYDEKIAALKVLSENMGADPALASIKADVDAFYTQLFNARDLQQGKEVILSTLSDELELQRVITAQAMYSTLGGLMQVFKSNSVQVADFYDLEVLRGALPGEEEDEEELIFQGLVNPASITNVLNPTLPQYAMGVSLRIKNTTTIPVIDGLRFYTANSAGEGWTVGGNLLNPGQEMTITVGPADFKPFFNVQNTGPNQQSFEVEIIA